MRGNVNYQVQVLWKEANTGIFAPGRSKHRDKEEVREEFIVREGRKPTWQEVAKRTPVYSYSVLDDYRRVTKDLLHFCRDKFNLRDAEKLSAFHIQAFLQSIIEINTIRYSSFKAYCAALQKLESALNLYSQKYNRGNQYSWTLEINEISRRAKCTLSREPRYAEGRGYENAQKVLAAIDHPDSQLCAALQIEGGHRIREASRLGPGHLGGYQADPVTGETKGVLHVKRVDSKGGKPRTVYVNVETYRRLETIIAERGTFQVDQDVYRNRLRAACRQVLQQHTGSHGLRWTFAQRRLDEFLAQGYTYLQALLAVSAEMGHSRADITEHYLQES